MIALLILCYCGLIWLIFFRLKLATFNLRAKISVVTIGIVAIGGLVILMNLFQPMCPSARIYHPTVPIAPEVSGRVIEVATQPNVPLKKGDVIFRIDPEPYRIEVERLEAKLAEAEQNVPQLRAALDSAVALRDFARADLERLEAAVKTAAVSQQDVDRARHQLRAAEADAERARLAYTSEIHGENTAVAQAKAALRTAKLNLEYCTYRAPEEGYVTQLFLRPGARAVTLPLSAVGTFVCSRESYIAAPFSPSSLRYVRAGDPVEVALETYPGRIFPGEVVDVVPITGEGQLSPSGTLRESTWFFGTGQVLVRVKLARELAAEAFEDAPPPAGTGGAVAIYTNRVKAISIVRRVIIRIQSWLNYL